MHERRACRDVLDPAEGGGYLEWRRAGSLQAEASADKSTVWHINAVTRVYGYCALTQKRQRLCSSAPTVNTHTRQQQRTIVERAAERAHKPLRDFMWFYVHSERRHSAGDMSATVAKRSPNLHSSSQGVSSIAPTASQLAAVVCHARTVLQRKKKGGK